MSENIKIKAPTYKEERLQYFQTHLRYVQKMYTQLLRKYKDAPALSEEAQKLSDAGRRIQFAQDVVEMLKKDQREGEWILHDGGEGTCPKCRTRQKDVWDYDNMQNYCGHCGAKMKGA